MVKILIIEDEQEIRGHLAKILHYEDFEVTEAENGRVGIECAKEILPELIICDIVMPGIDGYEVLLELRKFPATETIPFIFLTAQHREEAFRKGMLLGADDYLTKPLRIEELLSTIRVRLEKQRVMQQQSVQQLEELRLDLSSALPHELQTPLTGIMGFAQLLIGLGPEHLPSPEKIITFQQEILTNATRLQHLIENYLLYTKLIFINYQQSPKQALWEESIGLYAPCTSLKWVIEENARTYQREKDIELNAVEGTCRISEFVVRKIGAELLDNACKFSEPGSPIHIRCALTSQSFRFCVEDRGRGMSQEQIQRIGAFKQFDRHRYEQQGLGLGLTIVQLLAAQHRAECLIDSTPGKGTRVEIVFSLEEPTLVTERSGENG